LDRVFLDANVLYSAAYLEPSGLARLWELDGVELLTSAYAIEEVRRNLAMDRPEALPRLERLTKAITTVDAPQGLKLPASVRLVPKDQPILLAAIHGSADYLLTGDSRHFEQLYGKRIARVLVLRPAQYFVRRRQA
jgi:predicted nucleic acid-binding protein